MSEPYLILHKVRGEPAFDIAEPLIIGDEEGWIIPTSGHRAYPYSVAPLVQGQNFNSMLGLPALIKSDAPLWDATPDHYQASASRSRLATAASDILSLMGIGKAKPQEPVKRRVIPNG